MSDFAPGPLRVSRLLGGFTEDFETSTAARKNFWFGRIDPGISRLCPKASLGFGGKPLSYFDINCAARVAATWMRLKKNPARAGLWIRLEQADQCARELIRLLSLETFRAAAF